MKNINKKVLPPFIHLFFKRESAGGIVMIAFAIIALMVANSPLSNTYSTLSSGVKHFVNDALMVLFFLIIGLELKKEAREGVLARRDQILLPLVAAIGGMVFPALFFWMFNHNIPEHIHGWAIPCATDIAFAVTVLALLGTNIPASIKIFLLAVAIFDDLGAIMIIALFYSGGIQLIPLTIAAALVALLYMLNRKNVTIISAYMVTGAALSICLYFSGIHTTIAGVIVGISMPMRCLDKVIHNLHPYVSFAILPIFAFVNAGVNLSGVGVSDLLSPLPLGIAAGLFIGKQIGIFGASFVLIKSKLVSMPENASWMHIYAVSVIAGIGFTMSLFIGQLAFSDPHLQEMVKIGVMSGSLLCVVWGGLILRIAR